MANQPHPSRGEIWTLNLSPTVGHEQAGIRPCLIVSDDRFNRSPANLVIVIPITSKGKRIAFHVELAPPEDGLTMASYIKCEDVRSVSTDRLLRLLGAVSPQTLAEVEFRLRALMNL